MSEFRRVIIDSREASKKPAIWMETDPAAVNIPGTFMHEKLVPEVERLSAGDFRVELLEGAPSKWLTLESKTWDDWIATVRSGREGRADSRIRHQLTGLLGLMNLGQMCAILVVGTLTPGGGKGKHGVYVNYKGKRVLRPNLNWNEVYSALLAVQHMGLMVTFAESEAKVPEAIRIAANVVSRTEHFRQPGLQRFSSLAPALDGLTTTLTAVPRIGPETATVISRACDGSFPRFYEMSEKDLAGIKGVGPVLAARIWAHFHGYIDPKTIIDPYSPEYVPPVFR